MVKNCWTTTDMQNILFLKKCPQPVAKFNTERCLGNTFYSFGFGFIAIAIADIIIYSYDEIDVDRDLAVKRVP